MAVPNRPTSGAPIETAWGDVAHDTIVAEDLQAGFTDVVCNGINTDKAIVFPRPFASAPVVVATGDAAAHGSAVAKIVVGSITATGFTARIASTAGVTVAGTIRYGWMAYGPRA